MDKFYLLSTNIPSKFYLLSGKFLKYPKKNSEITFSLWDTEIDLGGNGLGEPGDTQAVFRSVWLDVYLYLCIGLTQQQCYLWLPPYGMCYFVFFCICICIFPIWILYQDIPCILRGSMQRSTPTGLFTIAMLQPGSSLRLCSFFVCIFFHWQHL